MKNVLAPSSSWGPGGHEEVADHLVPGSVSSEPIFQPIDQRFPLEPLVGRVADHQQGFPRLGHVPGEARVREQVVDQLRPLGGVAVVQERGDPTERRDHAGQVKVGPAEEFGVVGRGRGGHGRLDQLPIDFPIDQPGDRPDVTDGLRRGATIGRDRHDNHAQADRQAERRAAGSMDPHANRLRQLTRFTRPWASCCPSCLCPACLCPSCLCLCRLWPSSSARPSRPSP